MLVNLTVFGLLSGVILAGVFGVADPLIKENKARELKKAIFTVLPEARDYVTVPRAVKGEAFNVYVGLDEDGEPVGVAFKADGNGFSGNVGVMVGLAMDYVHLKGIEILEQLETPGLGDRIREPEFKDQFKGVEVKPELGYIKFVKPEKPNQIQAITGATISSDAVVTNINNAVAKLESVLPRGDVESEAAKALEQKRAAAEEAASEAGEEDGEDEDEGEEEEDED